MSKRDSTGLTHEETAATDTNGAESLSKRVKTFRVILNVGGTRFETTVDTLRNYPGSFFGMMFGEVHKAQADEDGSYFIDRSAEHFGAVLNLMRTGKVNLPATQTGVEALREEMQYYQLAEPFEAACSMHADYSRREICDLLIASHKSFFGVNLTELNLAGFDFRGCVMFQCIIRDASLRHALLEKCNLKKADLSGADLSYCICDSKTSFYQANLNSANLSNVTLGLGAYCHGADLTDVNFAGAKGGFIRVDEATQGLDAFVCVNEIPKSKFARGSALRDEGEIKFKDLWAEIVPSENQFVALSINDKSRILREMAGGTPRKESSATHVLRMGAYRKDSDGNVISVSWDRINR